MFLLPVTNSKSLKNLEERWEKLVDDLIITGYIDFVISKEISLSEASFVAILRIKISDDTNEVNCINREFTSLTQEEFHRLKEDLKKGQSEDMFNIIENLEYKQMPREEILEVKKLLGILKIQQ